MSAGDPGGRPPPDEEIYCAFDCIYSADSVTIWIEVRRDTRPDADPETIPLRLAPDDVRYPRDIATLPELGRRYDGRIVDHLKSELAGVLGRLHSRRDPTSATDSAPEGQDLPG
jgi:hypothetical protein